MLFPEICFFCFLVRVELGVAVRFVFQTRYIYKIELASNSESCLSFPNARIAGLGHHIEMDLFNVTGYSVAGFSPVPLSG